MTTDLEPTTTRDHDLLPVRGSTVLVLDDPRRGWFIQSGSVAVFRTLLHDGRPSGPRRYLFTCGHGETMVGAHRDLRQGAECLLAVGLEDALVREFYLEELILPAHTGAPATDDDRVTVALTPEDERLRGIETWIDRFSQLLIVQAAVIHTPRPRRFGEQQLEPTQGMGTVSSSINWIRIDAGTVWWCGRTELPLTQGASSVPLGRDGWIVASQAATVYLRTTVELESPAHLVDGLAQLHHFCFTHVHACEHREQEAEADRLRRQSELQLIDTDNALRAVGAVLRPEGAEVRSNSHLDTVLSVLGKELELTFKPPAKSEDPRRVADPLEAICRASQIPFRRVQLRRNWFQADGGCLLAYFKDDRCPVALLPTGGGRYQLFDPRSMGRRRVDAATANELMVEAIMFYRPFGDRMLSLLALYRFALKPLRKFIGLLIVFAVAEAVLGLVFPQATLMLIDEAIPDANKALIVQLMLGLLAVVFGQAAFVMLQGVMMSRLQTSTTTSMQSAMWDRLLRLPMSFFKNYSSGDLLNRSMIVSEISDEISGTALRAIISGGMSLLYFVLLYSYSPQLANIAVLIVAVLAIVTVVLARRIRQFGLNLERANSGLFGFVVQLIYGIAKLRVSGSELRAYNQWARQYAVQLRLTAELQQLQNWGMVFNYTLPVVGALILFSFATDIVTQPGAAAESNLSMGVFLAFMSGFGTMLAGVTDFSESLVDIMDSVGKVRLIRPLLETKVEFTDAQNDPGRISGNVALEDVSFRYRPDGPYILQHLNFHAEPGEFVAVVGQSGSGKSTLFRLMLGFEVPESGQVLYDHQDLTSLDVTAVRRQIGVVLQTAKINSSSIFEFITSGTQMTLDEAWDCAEGAGLADDIRAMPMGMHSIINEGGGSFSGGQRQRLMIARALATQAKVLLFDEATSALDNRTQEIVSESIRRRRVTRITIAHRLSTIRYADRIYVLEGGKVAQVGTYDELTATPGLFLRMMERQMA